MPPALTPTATVSESKFDSMDGHTSSVDDGEAQDDLDLKQSPSSCRFSLDDAFSDDGDAAQFEFTTDSILNELAKNIHAAQSWTQTNEGEFENVQTEPPLENPDASVSTIDINAPPLHEPDPNPAPVTLPPSPSPRDSNFSEYRDTAIDIPSPDSHHAYPSVVIDASNPQVAEALHDVHNPSSVQGANGRMAVLNGASVVEATSQAGNSQVSASQQNISSSSSVSVNSNARRSPSHRPTKSTGPSALEKVLSKTRPAYLPPKPRPEDRKHLADWEVMMKQSRAAEDHKKKLRQERRLARERAVEESTGVWESRILPDWKSAVRDPILRKMWWNGVPPKLRGIVWEKAIGNALALNTYRTCLARALRSLAAGTFPTTTLHLIDEDIRSTLPTLHIFNPSAGPLYQDLKDMLCAWVVSRADEGLGYVTGISKIAAVLLLNMQPANAFMSMRNLLEKHCMRSFYGGLSCREDVEAYYRIFDTLLADCMPKIYFNFKQHQISPSAYLPDWLLPLFTDHLPLEVCARIWDVIVLEGDSFLFRAALAVLAVLEPRLFFPDRKELLGLLRGENKAALEVAKRDGNLLGACKYEIYNVDEDHVWEEIEALEGWWKESTWARLIQRELPDL